MTFKEFLSEAFKVAEQNVLNKFALSDKKELRITYYQGTGRIKGGGKESGKADYDAVISLEKKGVVEIINKEDTSTHRHLDVKLKQKVQYVPNKKEIGVIGLIAKNSQEYSKKETDDEKFRYAVAVNKAKSNGDYDIISNLSRAGLVVFDIHEGIGFTKKGEKMFKDYIKGYDYIVY